MERIERKLQKMLEYHGDPVVLDAVLAREILATLIEQRTKLEQYRERYGELQKRPTISISVGHLSE